MVTTARVPTSPTASWQERTGLPPTCTVQTPHWAMPQPYLVPTRLSWSRSTHRRGMSSGTSTPRDGRLIVRVSMPLPLPLGQNHGADRAVVRLYGFEAP